MSEDRHDKALPGEPTFTLLARDPHAADMVLDWAYRRERSIKRGKHPESDIAKVREARAHSRLMTEWRIEHERTKQQASATTAIDNPYPPHEAARTE